MDFLDLAQIATDDSKFLQAIEHLQIIGSVDG